MHTKSRTALASFGSGRGNTMDIEFPEVVPDFDVKIRVLKNEKTLVPLGIQTEDGSAENDEIEFEIEILKNGVDDLQIDFLHNDAVIQTYFSSKQELDEVVITAEGSGNSSNESSGSDEDAPKNYPIGKYVVKWDGFDSNGIYDSTIFTSGKFKGHVKARSGELEKTAETKELSFKYKEVKWVDTKIDKNTKRIDVTLRVNLKDGGAKGIDCTETVVAPDPIVVKDCPWDDIPSSALITGKSPIKTRIKSYADLEQLAVTGLNYHWGRNNNHSVAKNVDINGEKYEVFMNALNTTEDAMDDVSLILNTNRKWMRSGNPGTVEGLISFIGNIVSREAVCYNVGYLKYSNGWGHQDVVDEDIAFKETAAHEIGHTILKAYGGTGYSYGHKGSVNTVTQSQSASATAYPTSGEIDIMPYYTNWVPYNQRHKMVAAEEDVLSLIWLTKIKLK
ncbi:MAG: hypothetical protein AB8B56_20950 [Crocinitomicaceae bacterium]